MPKQVEEKECPPEFTDWWIYSYGDMVTLLLAFFIMLYSFCKPDVEKFESVAESFKPVPPGTPFFLDGQPNILEAISRQVESSEIYDDVVLSVEDRGLVISFKDSVLFQQGSATLTTEAEESLTKFTTFLYGLPNELLIEGHTDDVPISTARFPSNWELSAARAGAVARFLEGEGIEAERMRVIGYADTKPKFRNESAEQRSLNRRIDVILKPQGP